MKDATHITLLIDRSGSMGMVKETADAAINGFLSEQKKVEGECTLRLVDFDAPDRYGRPDIEWFKVRHVGPLKGMKHYSIKPRGNTALYDAVAMEILNTGDYLESLPEEERPDKVVFVIETDGQENSSREYDLAAVRSMVEEQTEKYSWQFVFLGMGADAWGQGERIGTQSVIASARTDIAYAHTHAVTNAAVSNYRASGQHVHETLAGVSVDAEGKVTNDKGEELDPVTGKVIT